MGLMQSSLQRRRVVAATFSAKGWPAFMWSDDVYRRMKSFKIKRSMMGQRVRFYDDKNMCIEYARVAGTDRKRGQLYQRVDGPCDTRTLRTFPEALPASFAKGEGLGLMVPTTLRGEYAEVMHPPTGRCAAYRRTSQNIWLRLETPCSDTMDEVRVARALSKAALPRPRAASGGGRPARRTGTL